MKSLAPQRRGKSSKPRSDPQKEPQYGDYVGLIHNKAWDWSQKTGIPKEELVSEASVAFVHALNRLEPEKGSFSTLLWYEMRSHFCDLGDRWHRMSFYGEIHENALVQPCTQYLASAYSDLVNSLSTQAKHVADLAVNAGEWISDPVTPRKIAGLIRKRLKEEGWGKKKIENSIHELREVLKCGN